MPPPKPKEDPFPHAQLPAGPPPLCPRPLWSRTNGQHNNHVWARYIVGMKLPTQTGNAFDNIARLKKPRTIGYALHMLGFQGHRRVCNSVTSRHAHSFTNTKPRTQMCSTVNAPTPNIAGRHVSEMFCPSCTTHRCKQERYCRGPPPIPSYAEQNSRNSR